tara:strand:- start:35400 stop:35573 length:174 start_codon:yes stop_codon:yes gene_type:complete
LKVRKKPERKKNGLAPPEFLGRKKQDRPATPQRAMEKQRFIFASAASLGTFLQWRQM